MRLLSSSLATIAISSVLAAQTLIIPAPVANGTTEGTSSDTFPFNRTSATATTNDIRIQYVYDSTDFTGTAGSGPILINGLRFRANAVAATTTWVGGVYPNCQIRLGASQFNHDVITTNFAGNYVGGVEPAPIYTGAVTVQAGAGLGTTVPGQWVIQVNFPPVLYDATSGDDFILDIAHDGVWLPNSGTTGGSVSLDASTTTQGALTRRMYNSTDWTQPTGTGPFTSGSIVTELTYTPPVGTFASFTPSTADIGPGTTVNFTDTTFTSVVGGIVAWAWDFNGDSVIDSTVQNPSWSTWNCGANNVTLTVTDAASGQDTATGVITTFTPASSFTMSTDFGPAPLSVTFTDTSTFSPTSWAWDFNGDSIIDSTAQNPTFVYTTPGVVSNVTLVASNACGAGNTATDTVSTRSPVGSVENIGGCGVSWTFAPTGTGYVVSRSTSLFDPNLGALAGITGDDQLGAAIDLTFVFPWSDGVSSNLIRVDSNGRILRDGTDTGSDLSPTIDEMRNDLWASIAVCWADWNVNAVTTTGDVYFNTNGSVATITWFNVAQFGTGSTPCTFQCAMLADGTIIITIEDFSGFNLTVHSSVDDLIIGVTQGNGAANPGETDLSALSSGVFGLTVYELTDNPTELQDYQDTFLKSLTVPAQGGNWDVQMTSIRPTATTAFMLLGFGRTNIPLSIFGIDCSLVISPIAITQTIGLATPSTSNVFSLPLAVDPSTIGFVVYMQGVTTGGSNPFLPLVFSNGLAGTVGY